MPMNIFFTDFIFTPVNAVSGIFHSLQSSLSRIFASGWTTEAGLDWRTAEITHFREVRDLLGGAYYLDTRNAFAPSRQTQPGDRIDYSNTNTVDWLGAFIQTEKSSQNSSIYGMFGWAQNGYTLDLRPFVEADLDRLNRPRAFYGKLAHHACPTCGRCKIDVAGIAAQVEQRIAGIKKPLKIAVMGCAVNGPGEAREADLGIAGGDGLGLLFQKGRIISKVKEKDMVSQLVTLAKKMK